MVLVEVAGPGRPSRGPEPTGWSHGVVHRSLRLSRSPGVPDTPGDTLRTAGKDGTWIRSVSFSPP